MDMMCFRVGEERQAICSGDQAWSLACKAISNVELFRKQSSPPHFPFLEISKSRLIRFFLELRRWPLHKLAMTVWAALFSGHPFMGAGPGHAES